jgi:hypothetical protein
MRITICRGQNSLVRVEDNGRVGYFNAGRHVSDRQIARLASAKHVNLRNRPEVSYYRGKKK